MLIADDDPVVLHLVRRVLGEHYSVITAEEGLAAWSILEASDRPLVAVVNWQMPGLDGLELCRRVRSRSLPAPIYLVLMTSFHRAHHIREGFAAGADDYVTKPFDPEELRARVAVGCRIIGLQQSLAERVADLEAACSSIRRLRGLLPICSWCKRIRDDRNYWQEVETYLSEYSEATFTHGICPECSDRLKIEMESARKTPPKSGT